jgi:hypothetical protein
MFWKIAYGLSIAAGLAIWASTLIDMTQGFVILPSRYHGNTVIPSSAPNFFWGVAAAWFAGGAFFVFLGAYGLRHDRGPLKP